MSFLISKGYNIRDDLLLEMKSIVEVDDDDYAFVSLRNIDIIGLGLDDLGYELTN